MARPGARKTIHLDREVLLSHAEGGPLAAAASAHLSACRACSDAHAQVRELVLDLRAPALAAPPDPVLARAIGLFPARPPLLERVREALGRLVRIEGGLVPATAGVRGSSS